MTPPLLLVSWHSHPSLYAERGERGKGSKEKREERESEGMR